MISIRFVNNAFEFCLCILLSNNPNFSAHQQRHSAGVGESWPELASFCQTVGICQLRSLTHPCPMQSLIELVFVYNASESVVLIYMAVKCNKYTFRSKVNGLDIFIVCKCIVLLKMLYNAYRNFMYIPKNALKYTMPLYNSFS